MAYPGSATYRSTNPPESFVRATYASGKAPELIAGPDSGSPLPSAMLVDDPEPEEEPTQENPPVAQPEVEDEPAPPIENPPPPEEGEPD